MYRKSVMRVQSCCFAFKAYCFFFLPSVRPPRRWILKSLLQSYVATTTLQKRAGKGKEAKFSKVFQDQKFVFDCS